MFKKIISLFICVLILCGFQTWYPSEAAELLSGTEINLDNILNFDFNEFVPESLVNNSVIHGGAYGKFSVASSDIDNIMFGKKDDNHSVSVKYINSNTIDQLRYTLSAPLQSGVMNIEFSINIENYRSFAFLVDGVKENSESGYFYGMTMKDKTTWLGTYESGGTNLFSWNYGSWYRVGLEFNMKDKKLNMTVAPENSTEKVSASFDLSEWKSLTQIAWGFLGSDNALSKKRNGYIDDISLFREKTSLIEMKDHIAMYRNSGGAVVNNMKYDISVPYENNGKLYIPLAESVLLRGGSVLQASADNVRFVLSGSTFMVSYSSKYDTQKQNGALYINIDDFASIAKTQYLYDKCGYIVIGDGVQSFDMNIPDDKNMLDDVIKHIVFELPSSDEVSALISQKASNEHPRLLVTANDIERIKSDNDINLTLWKNNLISTSNWFLGRLNDLKYEINNLHLRGLGEITMGVTDLSLAYLLTDDVKYAEKAINVMLQVCYFKDWNSYDMLDTAEICYGLALGFDWCYNAMTDAQRAIIKNALRDRGLKEILRDLNNETVSGVDRTWLWSNPSSYAYPQNWIGVCCGSIGLAALAIGNEDSECNSLAGEVISKSMTPITDLLCDFGPDGAWFEGPSYWEYAVRYLTMLLAAMDSSIETDFNLSNAPGYSNGPYYIIGNSGSEGVFNLNDCPTELINSPEFFWFSNQYNDPAPAEYRMKYLKKYSNGTTNDFRDIIWFNKDYVSDSTEINSDGVWRGMNVASARSGFEADDIYAAIHGGEEGRDIGDLDYGTFILDMNGVRWAKDLGSEQRNYAVQRNGVRWRYYRSRAEGHNTLVLNPNGGEEQDKTAICPINIFEQNGSSAYAVTDITDAYKTSGGKSVVRGMYVDKKSKTLTVQDEIETAKSSEMYWFMHTDSDIEIRDGGRTAVLLQNGKRLGVSLIGGNGLKFTKSGANYLFSSTDPGDSMSDDSKVSKLVIHGSGVTNVKFAVKFYSLSDGEYPRILSGECKDISDWELREELRIENLRAEKNSGDRISIYADAVKHDNETHDMAFVAIAFAGERVTDCVISKYNFADDGNMPLRCNVSSAGAETLRVFLWDLKTLQPYINKNEIKISEIK